MADNRRTLLDVMKLLDPDGSPAQVIKLLAEENNLLNTMPFFPTNKELYHQITVQTGLPGAAYVGINEGVDATKGNTAQMTFDTGFIETRDQTDDNLLQVSGNAGGLLSMETMMKLESMGQTHTSTMFNGTLANAKAFVGLIEYYSTPSTNPQNSGFNILDGGGSGSDNESIWLVCWGPMRVYGIFPKNIGTAGFIRTFDGMHNAAADNGKTLRVWQNTYKWHAGLVVADWRSAIRIANLDISLLKASAPGETKLVDLLVTAIERVRGVGPKSPQIYMSEQMKTFLRLQIRKESNVNLTFENVAGKEVMMFDGIPVNKVDQLTLEETVVFP